MCNFLVISLLVIISATFLNCENTTILEDEILNTNQSYCFSFTWLGTDYDNSTRIENTTCGEFLGAKKAKGVPCRHPMVITYDGSPPDVEYMWTKYKINVACKRSRGYVCGKYSFYFNKAVQNITYMCTKAFAVDEGPVTSGCYKQMRDGFEVESCLCESLTGDVLPCNSASSTNQHLLISIGFFVILKTIWN